VPFDAEVVIGASIARKMERSAIADSRARARARDGDSLRLSSAMRCGADGIKRPLTCNSKC